MTKIYKHAMFTINTKRKHIEHFPVTQYTKSDWSHAQTTLQCF